MQHYSESEVRALQSVFRYYSKTDESRPSASNAKDAPGKFIYLAQLYCIVNELGQNEEISRMKNAIQELSFSQSTVPSGCITMHDFLFVIDQGRTSLVDSDKFPIIRMLVEYEQRAETGGMYLVAKEFLDHWKSLQREEETRQLDIIKAKHMKEKQKIIAAHEQQLLEFSRSWDQFAKEFEQKSETYLDELAETHRIQQAHLQQTVEEEVNSKPQRWSRELVDWRKREAIMADQQKYQEAQKIKSVSDALEAKERSHKNSAFQRSFILKERNLKAQQNAEKAALIKRIETKRREFEHKRKDDVACILQRNANILAMIDSKHAAQCSEAIKQIELMVKNRIKSI